MDQLVLVGVILLFGVLDAIAKKKKKEAQERAGQEPHTPTPEELDWEWEPVGEDLQPYDDDASSGETSEGVPSEDDGWRASAPSGGSEGLIPKDVWEEIAALAGGRPVPAPTRAEPVPAPTEPAPVVEPEHRPVKRVQRGPPRPDHMAHQAHAKYGTPVSERLRPLDTPEMHQGAARTAEIRSALDLLAGGGESLRQAVILQEVLGPPQGLRDD